MTMNRHEPFEELISASLRHGDLTREERQRLDRHLDTCAECRATLAAFSDQRRIVAGVRHVAPPRDLGGARSRRDRVRGPRPRCRGGAARSSCSRASAVAWRSSRAPSSPSSLLNDPTDRTRRPGLAEPTSIAVPRSERDDRPDPSSARSHRSRPARTRSPRRRRSQAPRRRRCRRPSPPCLPRRDRDPPTTRLMTVRDGATGEHDHRGRRPARRADRRRALAGRGLARLHHRRG